MVFKFLCMSLSVAVIFKLQTKWNTMMGFFSRGLFIVIVTVVVVLLLIHYPLIQFQLHVCLSSLQKQLSSFTKTLVTFEEKMVSIICSIVTNNLLYMINQNCVLENIIFLSPWKCFISFVLRRIFHCATYFFYLS